MLMQSLDVRFTGQVGDDRVGFAPFGAEFSCAVLDPIGGRDDQDAMAGASERPRRGEADAVGLPAPVTTATVRAATA